MANPPNPPNPSSTLKPLPMATGRRPRKPGAKADRMQKIRFAVQCLAFSGFLAQGFAYYALQFRPLGNLLPFSAYESIGHTVASSALLVWIGIFALTAVFGRFVCGWLCPFGWIQDLGESILRRLKVKLPAPTTQPRWARWGLTAVVLGHYLVLPLLASPVRLWEFDLHFQEPWLLGFPFRAGLFALDLGLVFAVMGIAMPLAFGPRAYCKLVCETGLLLDLSARWSFGRIRRNEGFSRDTCITCSKCKRICPQGIDVYEEVHLFDRVVNGDCISCMQCVNECPNDTIVYSLTKRARDTGKVAGYLASRRARVEDLPRHALTGAGAIAGGYVGLYVLPPSYFHTYLLLASLGGLCGWLLWRGAVALGGGAMTPEALAEAARSQVEREADAGVDPLSPKDKMRLLPETGGRSGRAILLVGIALLGTVGAIVGLAAWLPARIENLDRIPQTRAEPAARQELGVLHVGVPPVFAADEMERAFAPLGPWLSARLDQDVRLVTASSYAALAAGFERGLLDVAVLPPGVFVGLRRRASAAGRLGAVAVAVARRDGRRSYRAVIVARAGEGEPKTLGDLRGRRLAVTSLDSASGWVAPWTLLHAAGLLRADLGEVLLAGNHTAALDALAGGRVEAAASYEAGVAAYRRRARSQRFVTIAELEGVPNDVVVVRTDLDLAARTQIASALFAIADAPDAAAVRDGLSRAGIDGFTPADDLARLFADFERWLAQSP